MYSAAGRVNGSNEAQPCSLHGSVVSCGIDCGGKAIKWQLRSSENVHCCSCKLWSLPRVFDYLWLRPQCAAAMHRVFCILGAGRA